jgi:hypothetical protein
MGWSDFFSDPLGTIDDEILQPIGNEVSNLGSSIDDAIIQPIGNELSNLDDTVNDEVPGGWLTLAALAAGYADPTMFGGAELGAEGATMSGLDLGGAGAGADTWGASMAADAAAPLAETVGAAEFGQGSNIGLKMTGAEGLTGSQGAGTSLFSSTGSTATGGGLSAPSSGYFSGLTPPTSSGFDLGSLMSGAGSLMAKNPLTTARTAASLYDMYAKNKIAGKQQDQLNQNRADIMGMYSEGSPEMRALQQQIARKDAAAGRNSQYGTRAVDIAGAVAKYKADALAGTQRTQNELSNNVLNNRYGSLNSLFYNLPQMIKGG